MKILKRNQIIILVVALMLVSAGYLNYTANAENNTLQTSSDELQYASIGDAKLVSSNNVVESNYNETESLESISETEDEDNKETKETNYNIKKDEYFSESKLNREKMYSQMIESYQKILENETISSDQKTIAQTEIKNINETKNKIMICENLIKTKDIEDLIIFVNDKNISVVIKGKTIQEDKIAQIQNIIAREMQTEIANIHISNK